MQQALAAAALKWHFNIQYLVCGFDIFITAFGHCCYLQKLRAMQSRCSDVKVV